MSTSPAEQPELIEQLVAYLDGELATQECERIETLLATDPQVRAQLQRLEKAWDLLDRLPRVEVDASFTQSTVEMIAVAEAQQLALDEAAAPRRRYGLWLASAAGVLLTAAVGFVAFDALLPDANERLVRDLPVLEHLDEYRQAESVEFLRMLRDEQLFVEEDRNAL